MKTKSTRDRLLDAATEHFFRRGYEAVSLQRIAESVNLKQGNFYYHFPTKRSLGIAVLERWAEVNRENLAALERHRSPQKQILSFLDWSPEREQAYITFGCPVASLTEALLDESSPELSSEIPSVHRDSIVWLRERFIRLGLTASRSEKSAQFVFSLSQGAIYLCRTTGDASAVMAVRSELKTWLKAIANETNSGRND